MTSNARHWLWIHPLCAALFACGGTALDDEADVYMDVPDVSGPDAWWCLDPALEALPEPEPEQIVHFGDLLDWSSRSRRWQSLTATLCERTDPRCQQPLRSPLRFSDPLSTVSVPVPIGFDGFVRFELEYPEDTPAEDRILPVSYYLGGQIAVDGPGLPLQPFLQPRRVLSTLRDGSGRPLPPGRGTVQVGVLDCNQQPVRGARVELVLEGDPSESAVAFSIPASRIPVLQPPGVPPSTLASGLIGFSDLPSGSAQLRAYRPGDTSPFGTLDLGIVADQLSAGRILPTYLQGAEVPGSAGQ